MACLFSWPNTARRFLISCSVILICSIVLSNLFALHSPRARFSKSKLHGSLVSRLRLVHFATRLITRGSCKIKFNVRVYANMPNRLTSFAPNHVTARISKEWTYVCLYHASCPVYVFNQSCTCTIKLQVGQSLSFCVLRSACYTATVYLGASPHLEESKLKKTDFIEAPN